MKLLKIIIGFAMILTICSGCRIVNNFYDPVNGIVIDNSAKKELAK